MHACTCVGSHSVEGMRMVALGYPHAFLSCISGTFGINRLKFNSKALNIREKYGAWVILPEKTSASVEPGQREKKVVLVQSIQE